MTRTFSFIRLRRDDSGQTVVLAAVMLPILIGMVGLAVDVGYAFDYKKQMQLAADSAAIAGAYAVKVSGAISAGDLTTVSRMDTAGNGFTDGTAGISVTVCRPGVDVDCTSTYTYTSANGAVKVTISQAKSTFLTKILGFNSMTIGASGIASAYSAPSGGGNIVVLDTNCTNGSFTQSGSSNVTVTGSIYVNSCHSSGYTVSGGGDTIASGGVYIGCNSLGQCGNANASGGSTITPTATTGNPQLADPFAGLAEPTPTGPVWPSATYNSGTHTLYPGQYPAGINITGNTTNVTFMPGDYYVSNNQLKFASGATVTGDDVMFYGYDGSQLRIDNSGTTVTMSGRQSGTYTGFWWFQSRTNTTDPTIAGGATTNISGIIYAVNPANRLTFSGGSTSGSTAMYTIFVVWQLTISGGGVFNSDYSAIGGSPFGGGAPGIALAE